MMLKQRALYGEEKEDADFVALKTEVLQLKVPLAKFVDQMKTHLEGVRAVVKSTEELSQPSAFLPGNAPDPELAGLSASLQTALNNTKTGFGLVEVALDMGACFCYYIAER